MYLNAEAMFSMVDNCLPVSTYCLDGRIGNFAGRCHRRIQYYDGHRKERTTEIGIRRAIGARPKDILQQILSESMVLTTIAGMCGISFAVMVLQL